MFGRWGRLGAPKEKRNPFRFEGKRMSSSCGSGWETASPLEEVDLGNGVDGTDATNGTDGTDNLQTSKRPNIQTPKLRTTSKRPNIQTPKLRTTSKPPNSEPPPNLGTRIGRAEARPPRVRRHFLLRRAAARTATFSARIATAMTSAAERTSPSAASARQVYLSSKSVGSLTFPSSPFDLPHSMRFSC